MYLCHRFQGELGCDSTVSNGEHWASSIATVPGFPYHGQSTGFGVLLEQKTTEVQGAQSSSSLLPAWVL